ncbi:CbtB domain-containing protein [Halocatena pleomorpha]|uniref:CbtB-domain containing protein n=1 Tax=Halocatena pleomorpha TaxID=1785090 RepID=A0A3P3RMT6_9EURY|nr:CbtB domain-containing protein [Halocatena pleomorpha]RRJ33703.1 CbtB-domain containing protein [Halocatena pleomorpha]
MTTDTVHGRIERVRIDVTPTQLTLMVASIVAAGFVLLFLQDPMVHDSMHNFRHAVGVTCH